MDEYPLKYKIETGIHYSMAFTEWNAVVSLGGGIDELYKWDNGGYDTRFKAKVIAFSIARNMVSNHVEDAKAREADKQAKKRNRGR